MIGRTRLAAAPAWLLPAGLLATALTLRLALLTIWPFDGLYGQDPYFYHDYAHDLWSAMAHGETLPSTQWPVGYPLLVALVLPFVGSTGVAAQWVSLLAGALLAPLVYLLARDLLSLEEMPGVDARWTALVAGLLTAVSGQLLQSSLVVMSDAPALFWATLSAWALVRYTQRQRVGWLVLVAFALAWAVITRWEYALLAVPYAAYLWRQRPDRKRWWHLIPALLVGMIVLSPQWLLLSGGPASLGRPDVAGWSPFNASRQEFVTTSGFVDYAWPNAIFYAKPIVSPGYLLPLFTPAFILAGMLVLWRRWWGMAALLFSWGLVMYAVLAGLPFQNFRYSLTYLPSVMILTALGLKWSVDRITGRWQVAAIIVIGLGLLVMAGWGTYRTVELIEGWQTDKAVVRWTTHQVPADSQILTFGLTLTLRHYSRFDVHDLFLLSAADLEGLLAESRPTYLLVEVDNLQQQWLGQAPERNYRWLKEGPGLIRLGDKSSYTLFRVKQGVVSGLGATL